MNYTWVDISSAISGYYWTYQINRDAEGVTKLVVNDHTGTHITTVPNANHSSNPDGRDGVGRAAVKQAMAYHAYQQFVGGQEPAAILTVAQMAAELIEEA